MQSLPQNGKHPIISGEATMSKTSLEFVHKFRHLADLQYGKKNTRGYLSKWTIRHASSIVAHSAWLELNPQEKLVYL